MFEEFGRIQNPRPGNPTHKKGKTNESIAKDMVHGQFLQYGITGPTNDPVIVEALLNGPLGHAVEGWVIETNGDVRAKNVDFYGLDLPFIPFWFSQVTGDVDFTSNQLTTLKGSPTEVGGFFMCNNNQLSSLTGGPRKTGLGYDCSHNQIVDLSGMPVSVGGDFRLTHNRLTSLFNAPITVGGNLDLSYNKISSMANIDQPFKVYGNITLTGNPIHQMFKKVSFASLKF